jgi:hypothetical protein
MSQQRYWNSQMIYICIYIYCHVNECDFWQGFILDIRFIHHFNTQFVTTLNYRHSAVLYTLQIARVHAKSFPAISIFTSICLVTAPTIVIPLLPCSSPLWMALPYNWAQSESESESKLCYDCGLPPISSSWRQTLETHDQYFFQLNTCRYSPFVTSSLTRGWVGCLQFLLALANEVFLGSESHGNHDHILLPQTRDSPNLKGQVRVFISPTNRGAQLYPQALGSLFVASYDSQG